jgi:hypothetical protein
LTKYELAIHDLIVSNFFQYPDWLEQNKDKLKPEEYDNYLKQYGYIEKIIFTYDTQGEEGFDEVLKAVQDV